MDYNTQGRLKGVLLMSGIKSKVAQLEKKILPEDRPLTWRDWMFEEVLELIDNPTPELEERAAKTDWTGYLSELIDDD